MRATPEPAREHATSICRLDEGPIRLGDRPRRARRAADRSTCRPGLGSTRRWPAQAIAEGVVGQERGPRSWSSPRWPPTSSSAPPHASTGARPTSALLGDDGVVLEGYVDLIYREDDGSLVVVDYKTDAVPAGAVESRVAYYKPQLDAYCEALAAATGARCPQRCCSSRRDQHLHSGSGDERRGVRRDGPKRSWPRLSINGLIESVGWDFAVVPTDLFFMVEPIGVLALQSPPSAHGASRLACPTSWALRRSAVDLVHRCRAADRGDADRVVCAAR